jgi:peptide/nickel transport system substrate-binding protein
MFRLNRGLYQFIFYLSLLTLLLSACAVSGQTLGTGSTPTSEISPTPGPTPTAAGPRTLTICLGEEPNTLYPFSGPNAAALSVLSAINDGPIDTINYDYQPVILQKMPSIANGDAQLAPVAVSSGTKIVDADGNLTSLAAGIRVRPSSCRNDGCVILYDGISPLNMNQLVVTFRLRTNVTWSDGTPLTSDDSVYAYQLAASNDTPGSKFLVDRTQTYEAAGPAITQWWGIPGFVDQTFMTNFWTPAPKHIWSQFKAADLPQIDVAARAPIGWGPYKMQDWVKADHITLTKNPYYFRTSEGYPKFDRLIFRFIADPNAAISELSAGRCDILDPSIQLDSQVALLQEMKKAGQIHAYSVPGNAIEWLGLGIVPATLDNGVHPAPGARQDILGDPRTRQAIALCLDRQKVVDTVLFGQTTIPASFVPVDHPLYDSAVPTYKFDPTSGEQLLDQIGWKDLDGNPATPRVAVGIKGVPNGTALKLNYFSTPAAQRRQVADILSKSLAGCGIGVSVQYYTQNDLYAPGPVGLLFGRRFDLIEYAMSTNNIQPPCAWFTSAEIPNDVNHWVGTNVSGFKNAEYDAACHVAQFALPGEQSYTDAFHQTQAIFASTLPSIPLYYRIKVAAARGDVCHFDLDPSANPLWNIEAFDKGQGCQ